MFFQAATTLETVLSQVGSFFTAAVGWMGTAIDFVVDNPVVLIPVVLMPVAGVGIGYLKRLIRL